MKKLFILLYILLFSGSSLHGQLFWVENFESGSTAGEVVNTYTGPNGPWALTITGTEGTYYNQWYVSCAENGHTSGVCGTGCVPVTTTATGATLHVGSTTLGDMGASYDAGGIYNTTTSRRAESPVINCTGRYTITMKCYYIMDGQAGIDFASVWYYDGTSWALLVDPPLTAAICPMSQGLWTSYTYALPASANNNPNVKVGFQWVNNSDGVGTDPSFAVDSVALVALTSSVTPTPSFTDNESTVCQDSCIIFTNTTIGSVDSFTWTMPGGTITHPRSSPDTVCFASSGVYTMTLTDYYGGTAYTAVKTVTVNPAPHPVVTISGHTLSVASGYTSYQWYNGTSPISGATTHTYTCTSTAYYTVLVDSGGCLAISSPFAFSPLAVSANSGSEVRFWTSATPDGITIHSSEPMKESLTVSLFDPEGRQLLRETWTEGMDILQLHAGFLASGLYIIRLNNGNTSVVLRMLL